MRDFFHFDFSLRVSRIAMYYYTLSVVLLFDILDTQKVIWLCGQNVFKKFSVGEPDSIFDISENAPKGYFQFPFHILTLSSVPELAGWQELWWLPQFSSLNWLITLLHLSLNKPKKIYRQSKCFADTTSLLYSQSVIFISRSTAFTSCQLRSKQAKVRNIYVFIQTQITQWLV